MKIFSWMRHKRTRDDEGANKPNPQPSSYDHIKHQEEFSDWPNGLLAIGTFGNSNLKCSEKHSSQDHLDNMSTTAQDYEQLVDKQLRLLLDKHLISLDHEKHNLSVDELLECLHEDEKKIDDESRIHDCTHRQSTTSIVDGGRKGIKPEKNERGLGKKSLSYLIKKALLCRGGFVPPAAPVLTDTKLDRSKMEKILRAMLHKKIYPQRPTTPKKYLDHMPNETDSDEEACHTYTTSKWVKTDSEYIVLEI